MGACSCARGSYRAGETQSSAEAVQPTCWNTPRVVKCAQALAAGFSQEFSLLYKAGVWALSLTSSEENNHRVLPYWGHCTLQRGLGAAARVSLDWSVLDSGNAVSRPSRAWREAMGRARRRAGSLQQLCPAPVTSMTRQQGTQTQTPLGGGDGRSEAALPKYSGWAGQGITFSGGINEIYYCPSAYRDGNRRQRPSRDRQSCNGLDQLAPPSWVTSPCLTGLCQSARPSSTGFLHVDPALPTQSIQDGDQPPALGRIIIGK